MSNVTQNNQDFWPHTMHVTKDGKTNANIKSSFMHNLLHKVICFIVCKCLLISSTLKCSNKSLPLVKVRDFDPFLSLNHTFLQIGK